MIGTPPNPIGFYPHWLINLGGIANIFWHTQMAGKTQEISDDVPGKPAFIPPESWLICVWLALSASTPKSAKCFSTPAEVQPDRRASWESVNLLRSQGGDEDHDAAKRWNMWIKILGPNKDVEFKNYSMPPKKTCQDMSRCLAPLKKCMVSKKNAPPNPLGSKPRPHLAASAAWSSDQPSRPDVHPRAEPALGSPSSPRCPAAVHTVVHQGSFSRKWEKSWGKLNWKNQS